MDEKIYSKNFMIKKEEQTKKTSKGKKAQKTYKILIVDTEFGTRHLLSNFFNTDGDHLEAIVTGSVGETVKPARIPLLRNAEMMMITTAASLSHPTTGMRTNTAAITIVPAYKI